MCTGRQGPNRPKPMLEQPQESMPSLGTRLKIQQLGHLRAKINLARANYRVEPTYEREIALSRLVKQEQALSDDVGFGAAPETKHRLRNGGSAR